MVLLKVTAVAFISVITYYLLGSKPAPVDTSMLKDVVQGKRVLITGASSGIGEQLAYQYAALGASVFITARREENLKRIVAKCQELGVPGSRHGYVTADMGQTDQVIKVIPAAIESLGGLDVLHLNHATIGGIITEWQGTTQEISMLRKIHEVTFMSFVQLTSDAMPHLMSSSGAIGVSSSHYAHLAPVFGAPYGSAKYAVNGFFRGLRSELRYNKVNVSITIFPIGDVKSSSSDGERTALAEKLGVHPDVLYKDIYIPSPAEAATALLSATMLRQYDLWYPEEQGVWWMVFKAHIWPEFWEDAYNMFGLSS